MNVLIIPEDFRKDQYIVWPIVRRLLADIGKPNANVRVCRDPLMGGVSQALKWERIKEVLRRYPMVQLFLLLVDRDGIEGRRRSLDALEKKARAELQSGRAFFGENAWQEIEVWALAGQNLPASWRWRKIRAEANPKEVYFERLARQRGLQNEPGEGRKTMGLEAAQKYSRVQSRCKEDLLALERRIENWLKK
ncbi:MAG TPA: hypothetical protein VFW87_15685 [Pirellulales bacterium]|nr:hypothetical protein [Pirellulales bacterium]